VSGNAPVRRNRPVEGGPFWIISPVLDPRVTKLIAVALGLVIVTLVFATPATIGECQSNCGALKSVFGWASRIPVVGGMIAGAGSPVPLVLSYSAALALGMVLGLAMATTRLRKLNYSVVTEGGFQALAIRLAVYLLWAAQFVTAGPGMNENQITTGFFHSLGENRGLMLLWAAGIYLVSAMVTFGIAADIFVRIFKKDVT
jgi:hypothetical protein